MRSEILEFTEKLKVIFFKKIDKAPLILKRDSMSSKKDSLIIILAPTSAPECPYPIKNFSIVGSG